MMNIEPTGKHYTYKISEFDEKDFPVNYDKSKFPDGFDAINIDCYGDGSLREMFLSKEKDWMAIEDKSDVEKIICFIERTLIRQGLEKTIDGMKN